MQKEKLDLLWFAPKELMELMGNRELDLRHVNRLKDSLSEENLLHLNPVKITEDLLIIDGQHRVKAALDLGLEQIPCLVVKAGLEEAQKLNQLNRNWTVYDFAHSYEALGKKDYKTFRTFREATGFGANECISLLSGSKSANKGCSFVNFKAGLFKVKDLERAYVVADMAKDFEKFLFLAYKSRSFVLAFLGVCQVAGYNHEQMLHKLTLLPLRKCPSIRYYKQELENIYNYKVSADKRLSFVNI